LRARLPPGLLDEASEPFRQSGRFAYHFARGKLAQDPIFRELLQRGVLAPGGDFLDLGCGQGSWFACLLAARTLHDRGQWPSGWAKPPPVSSLRGVELTRSEVARASKAFGPQHPLVRIEQGVMCSAELGAPDVITLLDALHYVDHDRQARLLAKIRSVLVPGGLFITRVRDASAGWRFRFAILVDHIVSAVRGCRGARLYGRPLVEWQRILRDLGFEVQADPMSKGQPFTNVLLVCRVPA
jgi:SAM-dependent methyltransferase